MSIPEQSDNIEQESLLVALSCHIGYQNTALKTDPKWPNLYSRHST